MNLSFPKAMRWWEKGTRQPNMREIESARDLADSLLSAGDKLVVVDFFSPGCGGCRALHPKVRPRPRPHTYSRGKTAFPPPDDKLCRAAPGRPVRREEPGRGVPAGELRDAQVHVLQPPRPRPPLLQVLQGSPGAGQQLQLHECNCNDKLSSLKSPAKPTSLLALR
jgi:hypothetical protein